MPPLRWRTYHERGVVWALGFVVCSEVKDEWTVGLYFGYQLLGN